MKGTKKIITVLLIVAMIMGLAACGEKKDNEKTLEISVNIGGYGSDNFKAIGKKFEAEHEGVTVDVKDVYLRADQLEANLKNPKSTTTDLYVTGNGSMLKGYVAKGSSFTNSYDGVILEELSSVYSAIVPGENVTVGEKMYDQFERFHSWDMNDDGTEERYIMPWHANVMSFIYNTTVVNNALGGKSLPKTTDEFEKLCKTIKANGVNPFVLTLDASAHYWQGPVDTWWAQYSTVEAYNNFYRGIYDNQHSKDIYTDKGRLIALKEMERFIYKTNGYTHPDSPSFEVSAAQNTVFNGTSAFMANGDWFENEMRDSDSRKNNIAMMRTPVTSALSEKMSYYTDSIGYFDLSAEKRQEYDAKLSMIVAYVDGDMKKTELPSDVTDADIETVAKARKIVKTNASASSMLIPAFATGKELAKEFMKFMVRDDNLVLFMEKSSGSHLVFDFDFEKDADTRAVWDGLSSFRKSAYEIEKNSELIRFVNEPIEYKGGLMPYTDLTTQIERYMISSNEKDRMTAEQIYKHCIDYMDDDRWNNILRLAGIN